MRATRAESPKSTYECPVPTARPALVSARTRRDPRRGWRPRVGFAAFRRRGAGDVVTLIALENSRLAAVLKQLVVFLDGFGSRKVSPTWLFRFLERGVPS